MPVNTLVLGPMQLQREESPQGQPPPIQSADKTCFHSSVRSHWSSITKHSGVLGPQAPKTRCQTTWRTCKTTDSSSHCLFPSSSLASRLEARTEKMKKKTLQLESISCYVHRVHFCGNNRALLGGAFDFLTSPCGPPTPTLRTQSKEPAPLHSPRVVGEGRKQWPLLLLSFTIMSLPTNKLVLDNHFHARSISQ